MCGIALAVAKVSTVQLTPIINEMTDLVSHRGPDGSGIELYNNVALGHRRLSVVDLSDAGHQPMSKEHLLLSYNGEIYNYKELKNELESLGHTFNTATDTEVILNAYMQWGDSCVEHFNGMWAFVLLDKKFNQLFISRDRFGIKPLYYVDSELGFFCASEPKQLVKFTKRTVNRGVLELYLKGSKEETSDETFFEDIFKLTAGHNLLYDLKSNSFCIKRYYDYQALTSNEYDLEKSFRSTIALQLRSDVKLGLSLSGGVDSALIASYAAQNSDVDLTAIHGRSFDKRWDESHYAKKVAHNLHIPLIETVPDQDTFLSTAEQA